MSIWSEKMGNYDIPLPPKPVERPYTLVPLSTLSVITFLLLAIFSFSFGEPSSWILAPYRAAAVTAAMDNVWPSTFTDAPRLNDGLEPMKRVGPQGVLVVFQLLVRLYKFSQESRGGRRGARLGGSRFVTSGAVHELSSTYDIVEDHWHLKFGHSELTGLGGEILLT